MTKSVDETLVGSGTSDRDLKKEHRGYFWTAIRINLSFFDTPETRLNNKIKHADGLNNDLADCSSCKDPRYLPLVQKYRDLKAEIRSEILGLPGGNVRNYFVSVYNTLCNGERMWRRLRIEHSRIGKL
jgi:hypothetical protein